ncbi:hypothetical protein HYV69_01700 [Candidatus Uhrbacteria bacterium]|nr:hypothetical protein [Candidatus Uhrbacteria bacterium]
MRRRNFFRKTQQKRYASRTFRNPYFREKIDKRPAVILYGVMISFLFILIVLIIIFLKPSFKINEIHVVGLETISKTEIDDALRSYAGENLFLFFPRQNRYLFNQERLVVYLKNRFTLRDVTIKRIKNKIEIQIVERSSFLIWQTKGKSFVVDLEGVVIRESEEEEISSLPIFVDRNNVEINIGDAVLSPEEISSVLKFEEHLRAQNISYKQVEFDRLAGKWTGVLTNDGYRILFDVTGDIEAQAQRLELIKKEKITDVSKLEYIDLRFGDHVYYK